MDLGDLGSPAQLWRRWVLSAAAHAALERPGVAIRRQDGCAHLDDAAEGGTAWLRMRRLAGNRAVLWGHHPGLPADEAFRDEVLDDAPDWTYDVDSAHARRSVGFHGWHAQGSWWSLPTPVPAPVASLLAPLADDDVVRRTWRTAWPGAAEADLDVALADPEATALAAVVGAVAAPRAARQVALGRGWSAHALSDTATAHLRDQVHQQMRGACEASQRGELSRPVLLRQWAKVNVTGVPFRHAVCALGPGTTPALVASADDAGLGESELRSLDNVLLELRMAETGAGSGAWLFARVTCDGRAVQVERAYDTWPRWYAAPGPGPSMAALQAEMEQRAPAWRPSWASLLTPEG